MRILLLAATLALASCGSGESANNSAVSEETRATDVGPVADATAIDAATGQDANMAADVNYTFNDPAANNVTGNAAGNAATNASR